MKRSAGNQNGDTKNKDRTIGNKNRPSKYVRLPSYKENRVVLVKKGIE